MSCAVGLAGGEAGQGLWVGASRARRWLPYGFWSGGWAGGQPALVGDTASFPPCAARGACARVPKLGGCFLQGGRAAATGFSVAGAADARRGVSRPQRGRGERKRSGERMGACSCQSLEAAGRAGWAQGDLGLVAAEGQFGRAGEMPWEMLERGNICLWLLLSGQPQAGPAWLTQKSPGQLGQVSQAGSRKGKARPQCACTHAQLPTRRAWAGGFPAERAEKGRCTGMEGDRGQAGDGSSV